MSDPFRTEFDMDKNTKKLNYFINGLKNILVDIVKYFIFCIKNLWIFCRLKNMAILFKYSIALMFTFPVYIIQLIRIKGGLDEEEETGVCGFVYKYISGSECYRASILNGIINGIFIIEILVSALFFLLCVGQAFCG